MNTIGKHATLMLSTLLALASLSACNNPELPASAPKDTSSSDTATFPAPRGDLTVASEFGRIRIHHEDTRTIVVKRTLTNIGVNTSEPDWALKGNTLNLGTGCGSGFVGVCQPSYDITVPTNTKVHLKDTSAGE